MTGTVYVDESKRRDFLLVAGVVIPSNLTAARQQIRRLHLPGQRSIHMVKESPGRQKQILAAISAMDVDVRIYVAAKGQATGVAGRQECLRALLAHIAAEGQTRLVLDRDESLVNRDRRVIAEELRRLDYRDRLEYTHGKADQDPLLAVPDAIAWAWPQGGHWRSRCEQVVTAHHHI